MSGNGEWPTDPRLPGLALALDGGALLSELRRRLPECQRGAEPVDLRISGLQYRPGESATLVVKLRLREGDRSRRSMLVLNVLPLGQVPPPLPVAARTAARAADRGAGRAEDRADASSREPVMHWEDLGLHLHAFPHDPGLPTLAAALDPDRMRAAFDRVWRPSGRRVSRVSAKLLSYTPEARAALRYEVLSEDLRTGLPELRRLVGKLQHCRHPATTFGAHWLLWRATLRRALIAPPVGYVAAAGLALQEHLEGRRLCDLAGERSFVKAARGAARSLAVVNGEVLALPSARDAARESRTVERWIPVLSRIRPELARRLEAHGGRLKAELESRFRARGTVHGDFHLANVLVDGERVSLIDWDQVAHGDPALDPGRFLAALRVASLRVTGEPNGLADAAEAFLSCYLERSSEAERQVRLYESLCLLISAASPFRLQREGWGEQAELMIEESERALARAVSGPALAVARETPARLRLEQRARLEQRLRLEHRARLAEDPVLAQASLVPLLQAVHGPELELTTREPEVLARSPSWLHLRWKLEGWRGEQRWRGRVEGLAVGGREGLASWRRLNALVSAAGAPAHDDADAAAADAADWRDDLLALPRPLGHLHPASLVVFEPCPGRSLRSLLGTRQEARALAALGRGLAALATLPPLLPPFTDASEHPDAEEATARLIERQLLRGDPRAERLRDTLAWAQRARNEARHAPPRLAPTPLGVRLADIALHEGRAGLRRVRGLVCAPAGTLTAALLARLFTASLRGKATMEAGATLRRSFLESAAIDPEDLAVAEALALLERAGRALHSRSGGELAAALVDAAAERLGSWPSAEASW